MPPNTHFQLVSHIFQYYPTKIVKNLAGFLAFQEGGGGDVVQSLRGGGQGYKDFKFQNGGRFAVRIRCYHFGNRFEYLFILHLNNVIQKLININFSDIILNGIFSIYCS